MHTQAQIMPNTQICWYVAGLLCAASVSLIVSCFYTDVTQVYI